MKTRLLFTGVMAAMLFACSSEDNANTNNVNTKADNKGELAALQAKSLENLKQKFTFDAGRERVTLRTKKGVKINIVPSRLKLNGQPVQGLINVEYIEIFDRGTMVTANRTTMGVAGGGDEQILAPLSSGGEFFVNMTNQEGQNLDQGSEFQLVVPTALTGGDENAQDMTEWNGEENQDGDVIWEEETNDDGTNEDVPVQNDEFIMSLDKFGWCNIDKLVQFGFPGTSMYVGVPAGYDDTNTKIYVTFQGQQSLMVRLTGYDPATGLFDDHGYNTMPEGMACSVIFVSTQGGQWYYGVKNLVVPPGDPANPIVFAPGDLTTITSPALIAILNGLP